jgi:hypothetical protein
MWSLLQVYELGQSLEERWFVVARDMFDVPQARPADSGSFSGVAQPARAGRSSPPVWQESSAMLLLSR